MDLTPPPMPQVVARPPRGAVLVISPHPDDEIIGPGATLIHHAEAGDPIRLVFVCSGVHGDPDGLFDVEGYAERRANESRGVAARYLKTDDIHFYGYPDSLDSDGLDSTFGSLPDDHDEKRRVLIEGLAQDIAGHIEATQPRCVYYPWQGEVHLDHWAVGSAVKLLATNEARRFPDTAFMGYEVWTTLVPETLVDTSQTHAAKLEAIRCFETQMAYRDYASIVDGLNIHRAALTRDRSRTAAEAFVGHYGKGVQSCE